MLKKYRFEVSESFAAKTLAIAAFAPLLLNSQAGAENINPADYVENTYGTGDSAKYFKFVKNENDNYDISIVDNSEAADFSIKYNEADKITTVQDAANVDNVNGVFVDLTTNLYPAGVSVTGGNSIQNVTADFINTNCSHWAPQGGTIRVTGENSVIEHITGNFIGNHTIGNPNYGTNITIARKGKIGTINGNFIGNYTNSNGDTYGGAIFVQAQIDEINANFIGNYNTGKSIARGGAIHHNTGALGTITGDFISNYVYSDTSGYTYGGAIDSRNGSIELIKSNFIGNYSKSTSASATGGAIYNQSTIGDITGDFIDNYAQGSSATGGAIYNQNTIGIKDANGNMTGGGIIDSTFSGNYVTSTARAAYGGAIYNDGTIAEIKADFSENYAQTDASSAAGGAIYNKRTIGNIGGDFVNNHAQGGPSNGGAGGAIYNYSTGSSNRSAIGDITGNFINNSAKVSSYSVSASGGAISTSSNTQIGDITGDFIGNHAINDLGQAYGGAIDNRGKIGKVNGNFKDNYILGGNNSTYGGAIHNFNLRETFDDITGNFVNNYAKSSNYAYGGAIYNSGTMNKVTGDFIGNYTEGAKDAYGGAIFSGHANTSVGNVLIESTMGDITGNFRGNYTKSKNENAGAGAIYNTSSSDFNITGNFIENYAISESKSANGGAINNEGTRAHINLISGDFTDNHVNGASMSNGGAIYNNATINEISNSNFTGNYAKSENDAAYGGAIYTGTNLNLSASDEKESKFSGNYVEDINGKRPEAIYVDNNATLTLDARTKGQFVFDDQINGNAQYNLKIQGDNTGKIYFNNDIKNANIEHNDVTTYVNDAKYLNQPDALNSLTMNSGTINISKMAPVPLHFENFAMNGGTINIDSVDVDLANKKMGRITANSYSGENKGTINVKAINLVSDAKGLITPVEFADKSFKNTVKTTVKEAYTPIYKYKVEYDTKQKYGQDTDNGYFVFKRSASPTPEPTPPVPDNFNPAVYSSTVVAQAGGNTAMNQAMMFAFEHGDTFMNFSAMDRFAQINQNTYAMADTTPLLKNRRGEGVRYDKLALSTDYNNNAGYVDLSHENKSVWVKPYSVFEKIDLKHGPKVDTISYGTLIGFDSNIHKMKKGWYNVGTGYVGYNGSQIDYKGVDASMNGGLFGLTETFYKGNFWTALTATAGAGVADAHTMYGKDDMTMLMAGIGSKTGYNFEFADGKFIIQPRMFLSYSMVKTFDYTNAAGVRIDSDPMHTIQLHPAIKFIGNTKNGWQPYASVGMVWNLLNETEATANGVKLPEMHTKPYVEYGVGLQKLWNDKYSAYGQAMVRNGGRTGIALTLGFRMALGKDGKPIEKVEKQPNKILSSAQNEDTESKGLKQLSPTQKAHIMQTTRTSMTGLVR